MSYLNRFLSICLIVWSGLGVADEALLKRTDAQKFVRNMVKQYGFKRQDVVDILKQAKYQPKIIESMNKPYEKKNWDVYRDIFLTTERIDKGIAFWKRNKQILADVEKQYGVPAEMIVAIVGVETLYGERQGSYRVLDALTTLAFYYPKRSAFFTKELREYLLLCREQGVAPTEYLGSYAGAIGKPQFMPSSYRMYAIDSTGNGKRDLVHDDRDVINSVANYFKKHGWTQKKPVAVPAQVNHKNIKIVEKNTRTPGYELHRLVEAGIKPTIETRPTPRKAGVIELITDNGQEYWLAYPNFYVITRYNVSPQYALVVYLLSQKLREQWSVIHQSQTHV